MAGRPNLLTPPPPESAPGLATPGDLLCYPCEAQGAQRHCHYEVQIQRYYAVTCKSLPEGKVLSRIVKCSCAGFQQASMSNRLCNHAGAFLLACLANREKSSLTGCADIPSDKEGGAQLSFNDVASRKFYEAKRAGTWQLVDTPVEAAVKQPITEKDLDPVDMRFAKLWVQSRKAALAETEEQQSKPENRAKDDLRVRFRHCDHYAANNSSASQPSMPSLADSVSSSSIDDASAYPKSSRDSRASSSGEGSSEQGGAPQGQAPASPAEPFPALRGPYLQTDLPLPYDVRIPESVALGWRSRFEGYDHIADQAVEPFCTEPPGELCCFLTGQQALKMARYLLSTMKDEDACFVGFTSLPMCRCITSIFLSAAAHDRACS